MFILSDSTFISESLYFSVGGLLTNRKKILICHHQRREKNVTRSELTKKKFPSRLKLPINIKFKKSISIPTDPPTFVILPTGKQFQIEISHFRFTIFLITILDNRGLNWSLQFYLPYFEYEFKRFEVELILFLCKSETNGTSKPKTKSKSWSKRKNQLYCENMSWNEIFKLEFLVQTLCLSI